MEESSFGTSLVNPWEMSIPEAQARLYEAAERAFVAEMGMPIAGFNPDFATDFSSFGGKNSWGGEGYHAAVDIGPEDMNNLPYVNAVGPGRVVGVTDGSEEDMKKVYMGRKVIVEHTVQGFKFYPLYAHLSQVNVSVGQAVDASTVLGRMGNSGTPPRDPVTKEQWEMDPHLHFEVRKTLYVNLDRQGGASLSMTGASFWANDYDELCRGWADLGPRFGYAPEFTWPRRSLIQ